ncbi:transmembrane protease serine 9 [Trichuris trichiura]|uniref:Transmembrane protease serine 9 n=1 Tax=Trichuris trichiura TaxID=36087 RepID=A0A077Z3H4_TRITR|nr:transmembrane protease serine 9 [Trichuris trichiura]
MRGNCGSPAVKPNLSRIVGGRDAVPYSWPWHAAIYRRNILLGPTYLCGASLLNDQWLLSAGHCFFGLMKLHSYDVQLGAFRHADKEGEMIAVEKVYFHPKYNPLTLERDAALLKLKRKVKMSDKISPVCLPRSADEQPKNNSIAYVTGWGRTGESWTASHTLKQVDVVVYSADRCHQFYDHYVNTDVMICAGADEGGKDSCQGDSGGPLVSYDGSRKQWIQHGIVSWGFGCAEPDQPGVYSKVSSFVDWINGTVYGGKRSPTAGLVIDLSAIDGQQNSTDIQSSRIRQQEYEDAIAEQFWTPVGFDPAMMRQRLVDKNNNTEVR